MAESDASAAVFPARHSILAFPDPRLRDTARSVEAFDASLATLASDLLRPLDEPDVLGLAAPQLGDPRRVIAIQPTLDLSVPRLYVNPVVTSKRGLGFVEERCLSLPGVSGIVRRAMAVDVLAQDVTGERFEVRLEGMNAVCLQHEIDHLDGVLFIDRVSIFRRARFRRLERRAASTRSSVSV